MHPATARIEDAITNEPILYIGIDLGDQHWFVAFTDGNEMMNRTIDSGDYEALMEYIAEAKERFELGEDAPVFSCYEAGTDAFSVHRALHERSDAITNLVVHPDEAETGVKTDRLDAERLVRLYVRFIAGDHQIFKPVHVPSPEDEDDRRLHRHRHRLKQDRLRHLNRMMKLLKGQGLSLAVDPSDEGFETWLETVQTPDGRTLGRHLRQELLHEREQLLLVDSQIAEVEEAQRAYLADEGDPMKVEMINALRMLKGIGLQTAWVLVMEMYGWREFDNRREVGAYAGLCGQPKITGGTGPDKGIGKRGNRWVRWIAIEMAWNWVRWQGQSELGQWFLRKFGDDSSRNRRRGIVGLARKLLNRLRIYVHEGEVPNGASLDMSAVP